METQVIQYRFQLPDKPREDFKLELNPLDLELKNNVPENLPSWTKLDFHQCSNCPLDVVTHPRCPLAANIVNVVQRFDGLISYDKVKVDVITEERRISQETTVQKGISSIMGLVDGPIPPAPGK